MENDFENVRYFLQRNDPSDVRVGVFRMRGHASGLWQAHYWDWRAGGWHEEEDILRRYRNGFDADVEEVTEAQALEAIQKRERIVPGS
jgi:hypothetical protein